ncbi:MAG TPA: FAD-binding protein, partial [Candidatus Dormibacteraeota bacterium]
MWRNHTGGQRCDPVEIVRPRTLEDLVELVERAERDGKTVHAAGAGHSWSDIALTDGIMVEPDGLSGVELADPAELRPEADGSKLAWVGSGTHLRTLNPKLEG